MNKHVIAASGFCLALATAASAQTPAGPEIRINTYVTGRQLSARPAMEPDGDFVVVWTSYDQDGDEGGVFGQRFGASGAPRGSEFRMNTHTTSQQESPAVAVGSRGDFVVAWGSYFQDGDGSGLFAQRFDAAGAASGAEFMVNTTTYGNQVWPSVGRRSNGHFVVGWSRFAGYHFNSDPVARRFDASGVPIGGEIVMNTHTTGYQEGGTIAVEADGDFVAVWEDWTGRDGSGLGIFGQRFDASGTRLGSEFGVNTIVFDHQRVPSVSVAPAGGFVVVWTGPSDGSGTGVFARSFDASGGPMGGDFVVNTYTTGDQYANQYTWIGPVVAHDARGNFVITWTSNNQDGSSYGSFAQRFSASGARRGAEFRVNTFTTGYQGRPSVASDSVGNFVVAWDSAGQDGSGEGVFAQRFGGLGPAALAVDSLGNNVLEPGETVDVRPSWRNFNGAAQTFSGTLTNITGPVGATYTITDPVGDYGAVADGAIAPCVDCYAASVSNPATRPVTHWDASAVESILPDTQGQQKRWLLHVGRSFTDVPPANPFYRFVETLLHHGVTAGCSPTEYCPASATTRDQMAVFVLVAKDGVGYVPPACTTPVFGDVQPFSAFCRWIEELARRGVVTGCGGGNYCPFNAVTREQMPVFVLRTLDPTLVPPPCTPPNLYGDVAETSPFCPWIEELTRRGVVTGCGGGNYCPTAWLTREQMGVFISVTFGLTLYGP